MKQVLIGIALAALTATSGCQNSTPTYQFSCYNQHAIDAGFCPLPGGGRVVGGLVYGDYSQWRWRPAFAQ